METEITSKFVYDEDPDYKMEVVVQSFSYSMRMKPQQVYLSVHGTIYREGVRSKFALQKSRSGHTLSFSDSWIHNGLEPRKVALHVKQALLDFVSQNPDIPERVRPAFLKCILNHHLQKAK